MSKEKDLWLDYSIGGMKKITPVPGMRTRPPKIRWGEEYLSWPIERRLNYAERLASAMNHAADVLQTQANQDKEIIAHQEKQLVHMTKQYAGQGDLMHRELAGQDAEKQALYTEIVKLKSEIKGLKKQLKDLEDNDGDQY